MKRSEFFKKTVLGVFAIWKAPEILAEIIKPKVVESTKGILGYITTNYDLQYLTDMQRTLNINLQKHIFAEMDASMHWTPEEVKILMETKH